MSHGNRLRSSGSSSRLARSPDARARPSGKAKQAMAATTATEVSLSATPNGANPAFNGLRNIHSNAVPTNRTSTRFSAGPIAGSAARSRRTTS